MKNILAALLLFFTLSLPAQTLVYYGNDSVTVKEFKRAFQKNNAGISTRSSVQEYLDLYIASRLKVAEARAIGIDTLPQIIADMRDLREQLAASYITDKAAMDNMVTEAFARSQKDIRLAHIFISAEKAGDMESAKKRADIVLSELQKKSPVDFSAVAKKYSDDPSAANNGGEIGWITVFSLPYELENLAYNTQAGKISKLHRSTAGYHIFKNVAERKAAGKIKVSQILLAYPPEATSENKAEVRKRADSVHKVLLKGADFNSLAISISNDVISSASNGQVPEFGVGEYEPVFENAAFSLAANGAISKPFETSHGWHIIKTNSRTAVPTESTPDVLSNIRSQVELNDRMVVIREKSMEEVLKAVNMSELAFKFPEIISYSENIINNVSPANSLNINNSTELYRFSPATGKPSGSVTASDWISYAQVYRFKSDGSGLKSYDDLWKEFIKTRAVQFYEANLEYFNEDFSQQLKEFSDGNLFFEVMQQKVWGPAQTDTTALHNYYKANREKYNWKPSADAVMFFLSDASQIKHIMAELSASPLSWEEVVTDHSEILSADSSRFEFDQIPDASKQPLKKGMTSPVINKTDNSASFAYIINIYPQASGRSFAEAKGLVINDYQAEAEKNWIDELKKKYRVRVEERYLSQLGQ
jgi:peptidyl-prolyl cis-trans isomerase SurA